MNQENKLKIILQKKVYKNTFNKIIREISRKYEKSNPLNNCIEIKEYFGIGKGIKTTKDLLIKNNIIKSNCLVTNNKKVDFKGLYIICNENIPFYVGISKGVISRINQHIKGKSFNNSTLAYNIGLIQYEKNNGQKYGGTRKELILKSKVEPVKNFLINQKVTFLPIENNEERYISEIFYSMKLQTYLNNF